MATNIVNMLPQVRGSYRVNFDLSKILWFKTGGAASVIFKPMDVTDLVFFLKNKPAHIPVYTIGAGSNLIVRDGGIPGVVIKLTSGFNNVFIDGKTIDVGSGYLDKNLALLALNNEIGNLEFLSGIPGTIGGALRMNAGCYGGEMKDILQSCIAVDPKGMIHRLSVEDMGFGYRTCGIPEDWIFVSAQLKGNVATKSAIAAKMDEIRKMREESQPVRGQTGGSTFANPQGELKAWELIDKAGCRGLSYGGASMSEKHCNFMINTGAATSHELEKLGEMIRQKVKDQYHTDLNWEIKIIGQKLDNKDQQTAA